jgi:hypothetical protein
MLGFSAFAFSSSRRRMDLSQSKMPPQQGKRLLDLGDVAFGFGKHERLSSTSICSAVRAV